MIDEPPTEVDIRAILEALVETADHVERGAREREVESRRLLEVSGAAHPRDLELVMGVRLLRSDRKPGRDLLALVRDGRHQSCEPVRRRPTPGVDEHDHPALGRLDAVVALMRNRDPHPRRRAVVKPADRRVATAHPLEAARRGVDHDELRSPRQAGRLRFDRGQRLGESRLVLADHDHGDHDVKASARCSIWP